MVWHDHKAVQQESSSVPVTEHGVDQKFSIRCALEDAAAFKSNGCEGVGLRIEAHGGPAG